MPVKSSTPLSGPTVADLQKMVPTGLKPDGTELSAIEASLSNRTLGSTLANHAARQRA